MAAPASEADPSESTFIAPDGLMRFSQKIAAEFLGTAFLLMIIVGSGIMGESLGAAIAAQ